MRTPLAVALMTVAAALPAAAQQQRPAPTPSPLPTPAPLGGHVRLSASVFDNFFQAPDGDLQEDEAAAGVEAGLRKTLANGLQVRGTVDYTRYRDYRPSGGFDLGVRRESRTHSLDVLADVMRGRPSREVGDELDRADGVALVGQYGYRLGDFEPLVLAEVRHETYDLSPAKANDAYSVGAGLRVRGLGRVSPEIGFRVGRRDVEDDNEDLDNREVYFRLRWAPSPPTYVSLRLRRRYRDYAIDDVAASNFGREDTRTQLVASADFRTTRRVGFGAYYSVEGSDSTHPRGEFTAQMLAASVVFRF